MYIYASAHICMFACMTHILGTFDAHMCIHVYIELYAYIYIYIHTYYYTYMYILIPIYINTWYIYIYTYILILIYINTCISQISDTFDAHVIDSCHTRERIMSSSRRAMDSVTHLTESCHACIWVTSHRWMSQVVESPWDWVMSHMWLSHGTHVNESRHTCEWVMPHVWMTHSYVCR